MSYKIIVPLTEYQPSTTFQDDVRRVSPNMISNYGTYFRNAAAASKVPVQVLYTMAMIESTGSHYKSGVPIVTGTERSTGIMQLSPASFYETLKFEIPKRRITPQEQAMLKKYLPNFSFTLGSAIPPYTSALREQIFQALKNPEFNIAASAIVLKRLLEDTADSNGTMRLDKAIVKYNVGEYSKPTKTDVYKTGDTTAIVNSLNKITATYITKAVGKNGALQYYVTNNIS